MRTFALLRIFLGAGRNQVAALDATPNEPPATLTLERLVQLHPDLAARLLSDGAAAERSRIRGVYEAAPFPSRLDPLTERLMFDGRTQPEAAALALVAAMQANTAICAEAVRRAIDGPPFQFH